MNFPPPMELELCNDSDLMSWQAPVNPDTSTDKPKSNVGAMMCTASYMNAMHDTWQVIQTLTNIINCARGRLPLSLSLSLSLSLPLSRRTGIDWNQIGSYRTRELPPGSPQQTGGATRRKEATRLASRRRCGQREAPAVQVESGGGGERQMCVGRIDVLLLLLLHLC